VAKLDWVGLDEVADWDGRIEKKSTADAAFLAFCERVGDRGSVGLDGSLFF
jgi:hypothetical protein